MIDFKNAAVFKLTPDRKPNIKLVEDILVSGEQVIQTFTTVRDKVVFTNKRIIAVNVQGIGLKKDFTSLPYRKIQTFSVETTGALDMDAELDLWFSAVGKIQFQFLGSCNVRQINQIISEFVLNG